MHAAQRPVCRRVTALRAVSQRTCRSSFEPYVEDRKRTGTSSKAVAQLRDRKPLLCLSFFLLAFAFAGFIEACERGAVAAAASSSPSLPPSGSPGPNVRTFSSRILVANSGDNTVTTYTTDGDRVSPTITDGVNVPLGVAVDGKLNRIYVANAGDSTITTYTKNGSRTSPTIVVDVNQPYAIAVDSAGKIYVANYGSNTLTTYDKNGNQTKPTINGLDGPRGVAVDKSGKIYVVNSGSDTVTTYAAD